MTIEINGWRINNVPSCWADYPYIVFRVVDDMAWFYGGYDTEMQADNVAYEIGGCYTCTH